MMKNRIKFLLLGCMLCNITSANAATTFCNPLNLDYRFSLPRKVSHRTAADPVIVTYKGDYYLFASKSGGYWWTSDFKDWNLVVPNKTLNIEKYAPAVMVMGDTLLFTPSQDGDLYSSTDPKSGIWKRIGHPMDWKDPALFLDDDGRVYCYHGLSQADPIIKVNELDPNNGFKVVGETMVCLRGNPKAHGFEVREDNNTTGEPHIEGAWMTKVNGTYYLEYSGPGTQYRSYADGCYRSSSPTGPFTYCPNSPTTAKHRGFVTGTGHGCTFQDLQGNYWKISTMLVGAHHRFERRLALFPVSFDADGLPRSHTVMGDYPQFLPGVVDDPTVSNRPDWNLLSRAKTAQASSTLSSNVWNNALDEDIKTWWSAKTGDAGEWLSVDLGMPCSIQAIQINFAEQDCNAFGRELTVAQAYQLETSTEGKNWIPLYQKRDDTDTPHDYVELKEPVLARHLRITNQGPVPGFGKFAIRDLRVFGAGKIAAPTPVQNIQVKRKPQDKRSVTISWDPVPTADGYIIRYGIAPDKLYNHYQVFAEETDCIINSLNIDQTYSFVVDSYNEAGVTKGK